MANHSYVRLRDTQEASDIGACLLVVEGHNDHRPFPLFQISQAACKLFMVEARHGRLNGCPYVRSKLCEQAFLSLVAPSQVEDCHPACSQNERCELLRFTQAIRPESFQCRKQNLLGKVVRGLFISQMAQAVEPHTRGHAAVQLSLGITVTPGANPPHQLGVTQIYDQHSLILCVTARLFVTHTKY